jgi:DNA-binding ferritin-like protein (Dps family)
MAKKLKLTGSQTTDAYKQSLENAFSKLPGALQGSDTTAAYKQSLTDAFQKLKDNNPQLGGVDPAKAQYDALLNDARNTYGTQYKNTLADSVAGEGKFALDLGATLGSARSRP